MSIDTSVVVSVVSAVVALLSWLEAGRMRQQLSRARAETLPSVEKLGVVEVGGKTRAKLIVFNQRETPFIVYCVKCYQYDPKPHKLLNLVRRILGPLNGDYSRVDTFWNPKGTLGDEEHFAEESLPFTLVKDKEILLVTLSNFSPYKRYQFEVITSQGTTTIEGALSTNGKTGLPHEHSRTFT